MKTHGSNPPGIPETKHEGPITIIVNPPAQASSSGLTLTILSICIACLSIIVTLTFLYIGHLYYNGKKEMEAEIAKQRSEFTTRMNELESELRSEFTRMSEELRNEFRSKSEKEINDFRKKARNLARQSVQNASPETKNQTKEAAGKIEPRAERGEKLSPDEYLVMGNNAYFQGKYNTAIEAYKNALAIKPDSRTALYNMAVAYALLGKKAESLSKLKRAIALDSKNIDVPFMHSTAGNLRAGDAIEYWTAKEKAKTDEAFASLRDDPEFRELVK